MRWDCSPVSASGPEEFRNAFDQKIDGSDIAQVGTIYKVHASQARNEHIGIIFKRFCENLPAGQCIQELRQDHPTERRFKLPPSSEVDAVLKASGIFEYRPVLMELLGAGREGDSSTAHGRVDSCEPEIWASFCCSRGAGCRGQPIDNHAPSRRAQHPGREAGRHPLRDVSPS